MVITVEIEKILTISQQNEQKINKYAVDIKCFIVVYHSISADCFAATVYINTVGNWVNHTQLLCFLFIFKGEEGYRLKIVGGKKKKKEKKINRNQR